MKEQSGLIIFSVAEHKLYWKAPIDYLGPRVYGLQINQMSIESYNGTEV